MWIPHPEVGQPFLAFHHWQRCMESKVVSVAVLEKVVEEHRVAFDRPNLEALSVHSLGKRRLSSCAFIGLVGEVQKKSYQPRGGLSMSPPIVVRIILLPIDIVNHLHFLRIRVRMQ